MAQKSLQETILAVLSAYLALFLFLDALMSSFAFLINWEAWFFGIKLDGWPAGLYLAATALAAVFLVVLLLKYPHRSFAICTVSVLYFAFVYIMPVFSRQKNLKSDLGWTVFWIELVLYIVIPSVILGVSALLGRTKSGEST
ncbi:hypothetical protein [Methanoregula sp.]|uniref:hypothetical protein n=1 Tax=Methanoregula sp. TaxID=2052170 RepID=UPI003564263B